MDVHPGSKAKDVSITSITTPFLHFRAFMVSWKTAPNLWNGPRHVAHHNHQCGAQGARHLKAFSRMPRMSSSEALDHADIFDHPPPRNPTPPQFSIIPFSFQKAFVVIATGYFIRNGKRKANTHKNMRETRQNDTTVGNTKTTRGNEIIKCADSAT